MYKIPGFIFIMAAVYTNAASQQVRIMTYNIRHAEDMNGKANIEQIAAVINKYKPDIVALQEVDSVTNRNGKVDQMKELEIRTGMHASFGRHFAYDGGAYGLGILSRFTIKNSSSYRLPYYKDDTNGDTRLLLMAELQLKRGRTLHFATAHLDYKKDSFRVVQAKNLVNQLHTNNKAPVIIAGDFNAGPAEECIAVMKSEFLQLMPQDSAYTYPSDKPSVKIDYIFLSGDTSWQMIKQEVIDERIASDHRPVLGIVRLKK